LRFSQRVPLNALHGVISQKKILFKTTEIVRKAGVTAENRTEDEPRALMLN
jgi:hypothetical protein